MVFLKNIYIFEFIFFIISQIGVLIYLVKTQVSFSEKLLIWAVSFVVISLVIELTFRAFYRYFSGARYKFIPKLNYKKMYMEPHPYIPVVYKKHFQSQKPMAAILPLNQNKDFRYGQFTSNNFRHIDGPKGDRDIVVPKPESQFRILCLGASTTGNYIQYEGKEYSYPMELELYLKNRYPKKDIIVHNCGHGGWTSAEILINFLLNLYDTEPDVVLIYHAYNDLIPSLTPGFLSDYSHARRNLGEMIHKYRIASGIPNLPFAIYNHLLNHVFPYMNPRHGVIQATSRNKPDLNGQFRGLNTYGRNIEHLVKVCKESKINVMLSTFCHYLYAEIKNSKVHLKYMEGLQGENEEMKKIAQKHQIPLVDNRQLIPEEEKYFVDSVHFSPDGMKLLARNFGEEIVKIIENDSTD